jgi:KTSC domain
VSIRAILTLSAILESEYIGARYVTERKQQRGQLMTLKPVESSSINSVGHDSIHNVLYVHFKTGAVYAYAGVEAAEHQALLDSHSIGAHFAKHIRPIYKGEQI